MKKSVQESQTPMVKRGRGRPKKDPSQKAVKKTTRPKLTLAEKQEQKLKIQQERQARKAASGEAEPKNKERFYCTNKELQAELIKWRDSNLEEENRRIASGQPIDYTARKITNELGTMLLQIGNKLLNHSNFRNYPKEMKEDMRSYGILKVIKGLKNYNFKFNNPFAWMTQAFYNSYLIIIGKHYKHINTRKELMNKYLSDLESFNGMSPNTSLARYIKNYIGEEDTVAEE